jgi:hypothetical protein
MNKAELDIIIGTLTAVINMLVALDPALGQNKIIADLQAAIVALQALGI